MNPAFMRPKPRPGTHPHRQGSTYPSGYKAPTQRNAEQHKQKDPLWYQYRFTLFIGFIILIALMLPGRAFSGLTVPILGLDKMIHFALFFFFSFAFSVEMKLARGKLPGFGTGFLLLCLFAFSTEALQLLAEGRSFDVRDGLADLAGVFSARILAGFIYFITGKSNAAKKRNKTSGDTRRNRG